MMNIQLLKRLCLLSCCALLVQCTTQDWHVLVLTYEGTEEEGGAVLSTISGRLTRALSERGFECRTDFGHDDFFSSCKTVDSESAIQGTTSFVDVEYIDELGNIKVNIKSGTVAWHPFGPSDTYYREWKSYVTAVVDTMTGITYTSYTVD
jgi:hypothetical protein